MTGKSIRRAIFILLAAAIIYAVYYAWFAFPIISGYNAKMLCSCVFLAGRREADVKNLDLSMFPLSAGNTKINWKDSSVTGSVLGLARRKAIYRKGCGCTLVNERSEEEIRSQKFFIPEAQHLDSAAWPAGERVADTPSLVWNRAALDDALSFAFADHKAHTYAVIVLYKGRMVAERYADGFGPQTLILGWSMAKSITAALTGILVKQGQLQLNAPAPVAEWKNPKDRRHAITLENLLQQTSGLDFAEKYDRFSEVTNMLFSKGDMAGFAAGLPAKYDAGTVFNYSGGNSNILSRIIRQTVGEHAYAGFPHTALFEKIGAHSMVLEPDASGTYVGSSYVFATARDYARFGLLYANDGVWMGERILPEGWVQRTRTTPAANRLQNYGYQFWLNGLDKKDTSLREFPDVPADMYYADGYGGQNIYIIPSKDLVVVRLGLHVIDANIFLKKVLQSLP